MYRPVIPGEKFLWRSDRYLHSSSTGVRQNNLLLFAGPAHSSSSPSACKATAGLRCRRALQLPGLYLEQQSSTNYYTHARVLVFTTAMTRDLTERTQGLSQRRKKGALCKRAFWNSCTFHGAEWVWVYNFRL